MRPLDESGKPLGHRTRPLVDKPPSMGGPGKCDNPLCPATQATKWCKGLCKACYVYQSRHGVPRPIKN